MSSAGTIFREDIKQISNSSANSVEFIVDIENDGFIMTLDKTDESPNLAVSVYSVGPNEIEDILIADCVIKKNRPEQISRMCARQILIRCTWTGTMTASIATKSISGAAVSAYRKQLEEDSSPLATKEQLAQVISIQKELRELTETLLSHARFITQINDSDGEKY